MEYQALDWWVFCPINPATQHIILKIVGFQVDVMAAVLPKIATVFCSLFVLLATDTTPAFRTRIFTSFPLQCHTVRLLFTLPESFYYINFGLLIMWPVSQIISGMTLVFLLSREKCELKCQNELFLKYHFSGNTNVYVFINEIIWWTFDVIIDNP